MFVTPANAETVAPDASGATPAHGETHGTVGVAEGGHKPGFPPMETEFFPSQILWLAISFGVFYLILQRLILPRLGSIIENRRDRVALDLEAAQKMKLDSDAAQAAYAQELAAARDRSHRIALAARDSAKADADAERARIDGELNAQLEAAQARIEQIKRTALADVGTIAEEATGAIMNALTGLDASPDEVAGAVRDVRA